MKKIILATIIIAYLASCKKESEKQCYNCQYGTINGYTRPDDTYCGDVTQYRPKDTQGNDLPVWCQPK